MYVYDPVGATRSTSATAVSCEARMLVIGFAPFASKASPPIDPGSRTLGHRVVWAAQADATLP